LTTDIDVCWTVNSSSIIDIEYDLLYTVVAKFMGDYFIWEEVSHED